MPLRIMRRSLAWVRMGMKMRDAARVAMHVEVDALAPQAVATCGTPAAYDPQPIAMRNRSPRKLRSTNRGIPDAAHPPSRLASSPFIATFQLSARKRAAAPKSP